jgi:anti-sigma-K factor RskA
MSVHDLVHELIPEYSLGSLGETDSLLVTGHIQECSACYQEYLSYRSVSAELGLAAAIVTPPADLRTRIMAIARSAEQQAAANSKSTPPSTLTRKPASAARPSLWDRLSGLFRLNNPAFGLAAAALILLLALGNLLLWQQVNSLQAAVKPSPQAAAMRTISLTGTDNAKQAIGMIVISGDGDHGTLVAERLPMLDKDHQYQLWLVKDGKRVNGGVFSVNVEGYGALLVESAQPLNSYQSFGITIEPFGGSPGPTGKKVLGGNL